MAPATTSSRAGPTGLGGLLHGALTGTFASARHQAAKSRPSGMNRKANRVIFCFWSAERNRWLPSAASPMEIFDSSFAVQRPR